MQDMSNPLTAIKRIPTSLLAGPHSQGGYIERQGWSSGGADKTGTVDLPMAFPSFARFGVATAMGTAGVIGCSSVTKTTATIRTSGITNLYTYLLVFGY